MRLFSIVIPTYNRAALLNETLKSVMAQDSSDFEVLVVDDGSTDETPAVLKSFGDKIQCLSQKNRGPGAARNLGAEKAGGKYLAFLDSDDLFFPWSLRTYAEVIRCHQEPAFLAGKPRLFKTGEELGSVPAGTLAGNIFRDYLTSGDEWRWWGASSFVIRRDQFLAAGGFANELINGEDADLALRLGTAPGFVQVVGPETFAYRQHGANVMNNVARNVLGARYQVEQEQAGVYPGRRERARERWRIITRHVRAATREGLRAGQAGEAWRLYRDTWRWNLALGNWKYLMGFPTLAAICRARASGLKASGVSG